MFDYYFACWDELPEDSGFALFSLTHITWLVVIAAGIFGALRYYTKCNNIRRKRLRIILAVIMISMELYKYTLLLITGNMKLQYLPFQLCALAVIAEIIYLLRPGYILGEIICIVAMPGAMAALIFPDWTRYPVINFVSLDSFIIHGILIMIPICIMVSGEHKPQISNMGKIILILAAASLIVGIINILLDTNFMFLRWPSQGSPFEHIYVKYGYISYLTTFAAVVIAVIFVMYKTAGVIVKIGCTQKK